MMAHRNALKLLELLPELSRQALWNKHKEHGCFINTRPFQPGAILQRMEKVEVKD